MNAFSKPLEALTEEASFFIRARELRVLNVVTPSDLRSAAIEVVKAQEFHADNLSPFLVLEDAHEAGSPGWTERTERLRAQHEARREAMAREGATLPPLPPPPPESLAPLLRFAAQVQQLAEAYVEPMSGLVVVLAPSRMTDAQGWEAALAQLVQSPALAEIRWVVIDLERSSVRGLLEVLGAGALIHRVSFDEAAQRDELQQMLEGRAGASPAAAPLARAGAAWPSQSPPPRGPVRSAHVEGLSSELAAAQVLERATQKTLQAALALRNNKGLEAIALQREARDLCEQGNLARESILMELTLAAFVARQGDRPRALQLYQRAAGRAQTAALPVLTAQAHLGSGLLELVGRRPELAIEAFLTAAHVARDANEPAVAIEAFRLAGQTAAEAKREADATAAWKAALAVADSTGPEIAASTGAAEVARALAALCRKRGLHAQADSLEEQSLRLEGPQEGPTAEERQAS